MSVNILVATPQTALGELLRLSLEESSKYRVRLVQSGREALAAAGRIVFDLVILDAALNDQPMPGLIRTLLEPDTGLKLVVIPPENDPNRMNLNGLRPDAYLNLPFYVPDLFELVGSLLQGVDSVKAGKAETSPPDHPAHFNKNPEEITALLGSLLGQTPAQAGLVISNRELLGSGGRLDKKRVEEIADLVNRSWEEQNSGDLARYVRLTEGGGEYMVYATALVAGAVLALVYDPSAPMTRIHGQAVKTAQALRALPDQGTPEQPQSNSEKEQNPPALATLVSDAQAIQETPAAESPSRPEAASEELTDLFSSPAPTGQAAADLLLALKTHEEDRGQQPAANEMPDAPELIQPAPELIRPPQETVHRVIEAIQAIPEEVQQAPAAIHPAQDADLVEGEGEDVGDAEGELPEISLSDLLAAMPPPDPGESKLEPGVEWITGDEEDGSVGDFLFPWEKVAQGKEAAAAASREIIQPAVEAASMNVSSIPAAEAAAVDAQVEQTVAITTPESSASHGSLANLPEPPPSEGATEKIIRPAAPAPPVDVTLPMNFQGAAPTERTATPFAVVPLSSPGVPEPWNRVDELDAPIGDFASLTYTCVMVPRLPDIKLSGRLVNMLAERMQHICLAYGWRLVRQVIRPDIFQWTVQVSAIVSPGSVARVVRQQTSQFIFDKFDQFNGILSSGDFWAPGYLIISGAQPPDTRLIGEYIKQTRKRQGLSV